MRYRLVGTVQPDGETVASAPCCGGGGDGVTNAVTGGGGGGGDTCASTRPGEGTRKRPAEAPPQFARLRRSTSVDTSAAAQQVLELQRCSSVPDFGATVPKLRPFGPRIPPSRPRQEGGGGGGGSGGGGGNGGGGRAAAAAAAESMSLDDIWADAAMAAMLTDDAPKASVHAAAAADDEAEFVYDEYAIAAEGDLSGEYVDGPQLFWDELEGGGVADGVEGFDGDGESDSQGEQDYPDEESEAGSEPGSGSDDDDPRGGYLR